MIEDYHRKLTQRVNLLLSKAELQVNQADLIKEVAVFAERADISEEIQRLTSHLEAFEQACNDRRARGPQAGFHRPGNAARGQHHRQQGQRRGDRHGTSWRSRGRSTG